MSPGEKMFFSILLTIFGYFTAFSAGFLCGSDKPDPAISFGMSLLVAISVVAHVVILLIK